MFYQPAVELCMGYGTKTEASSCWMMRCGSEREEKRLSAANESHHARSIELSLCLTGGFNTVVAALCSLSMDQDLIANI